LERLKRLVELPCLLVQRPERRAADRFEVGNVAPGRVFGSLREQLRGVGPGVVSGERPGDREPQECHLPGGAGQLRQPGEQRVAAVGGLGRPPGVEQRGDPLGGERRREVARRPARARAPALQPREPLRGVVDRDRRAPASPFHDGPNQRDRRPTELRGRAADRAPRRVGGVECRGDLVGSVLDSTPCVCAEQVGRELRVGAVDAYIGEEPARGLDLTGTCRDHRQLDPKPLGRAASEGITTPPRQSCEQRARGVASVADGDPCVDGPAGRGQPTILVTRAGGLLEHVVG
jgi:hypothetical protein